MAAGDSQKTSFFSASLIKLELTCWATKHYKNFLCLNYTLQKVIGAAYYYGYA